MANFVEHNFYCINCGSRGIPLSRKKGHQHGRFHRKKMYCVKCREEINHIECKTQEDIIEFTTNFKNGVYQEEAKESLLFAKQDKGVW